MIVVPLFQLSLKLTALKCNLWRMSSVHVVDIIIIIVVDFWLYLDERVNVVVFITINHVITWPHKSRANTRVHMHTTTDAPFPWSMEHGVWPCLRHNPLLLYLYAAKMKFKQTYSELHRTDDYSCQLVLVFTCFWCMTISTTQLNG